MRVDKLVAQRQADPQAAKTPVQACLALWKLAKTCRRLS
jgi:hypothetical protein